MAIIKLENPFNAFEGSLQHKGIIYRRKRYKDDKGRIVHEGQQEAYAVRRTRDYKTNPPQGAELASINRFAEASARTKLIMQSVAGTLPAPSTPAEAAEQTRLKEQYDNFLARFNAQLKGAPDPQAPRDKSTNRPKHYYRLDNFIRALLLKTPNPEQ